MITIIDLPIKAQAINVNLPRDCEGSLQSPRITFDNAIYLGQNISNPILDQANTEMSGEELLPFSEAHPTFVHPLQMLDWCMTYIYESPEHLVKIQGAIKC